MADACNKRGIIVACPGPADGNTGMRLSIESKQSAAIKSARSARLERAAIQTGQIVHQLQQTLAGGGDIPDAFIQVALALQRQLKEQPLIPGKCKLTLDLD